MQSDFAATVTPQLLATDPYETLHQLRSTKPVAWIPSLNGWLVTRRDLAVEAMRNPETFTVEDERFTTQQVLGPSMLSLDGAEHERHRKPFAPAFRPSTVRTGLETYLFEEARRLVDGLKPNRQAELRTQLAGPLAVNTITRFLELEGVESETVLTWYSHISDAIVGLAGGRPISDACRSAVADVANRVDETVRGGASEFLQSLEEDGSLRPDELGPATIVLMFGGIETSEGMTANALWHLLSHPGTLRRVQAHPELLSAAIEESLRLEPAASVVDRYATRDLNFGGAQIREGDLVTLSLLGANRDPDVFEHPDEFDIDRTNLGQHVTFVQGPHGCIGLHLARLETEAALSAVLDLGSALRLDVANSSGPQGLIFRKPQAVAARW
nr:putative cytochrome P450 [uncultured bacterium]